MITTNNMNKNMNNMNKNMKLKNLAEIGVGYPFRKKIITSPNGEIIVIQMKDVNDSGAVDCSTLDRINTVNQDPNNGIEIKKGKYFLKPGDILFKSKGSKNNAGVLIDDIGPAVASQQFIIIKVRSEKVKPPFVAWYFNHLNTTGYFDKENEGTYIPFVSKKTVSNVTIPVPNLELQKKIVGYYRLVQKEADLLERIKNKRKMLMQAVLSLNIAKYK